MSIGCTQMTKSKDSSVCAYLGSEDEAGMLKLRRLMAGIAETAAVLVDLVDGGG